MPLEDTVTFSKREYDYHMCEVYDATTCMNSLFDAISLSDESNELFLDKEKIFFALKSIYPERFKKKISALKAKRSQRLLSHTHKEQA